MKDLGEKAKEGVLWFSTFTTIEFFFRFCGQVVLARVLFPEDFGLMGIVMVVIQFCRNTASIGVQGALVQLDEIKKEHYDTGFTINLILMSFVSFILFMLSSHIAIFFNDERLTYLLMAISLDFILKAFMVFPIILFKRNMQFKEISFIGTLDSSINVLFSVIFAFMGFRVWSLVIGYLLGSLSAVIVYYCICHQRPRLRIYIWALKDIMSYVVWSSILKNVEFLISNIDKIVIGRFLNIMQLGYYERAYNLIDIVRKHIVKRMNMVLFPAYSRIQNQKERTNTAFLKVFCYVAFLCYPIMITFYFAAPSLIIVLYGEKWQPAIIPMQFMCILAVAGPMAQLFPPLLNANGYVRQRTILQIIYFILLFGGVLYGSQWGINGIAICMSILSVILFLLMSVYTHSKIGIKIGQLFIAQKSSMIYGIVQIGCLVLVGKATSSYISQDSLAMLVLTGIMSVSSLMCTHFIFRFKDIDDIFQDAIATSKKFTYKIVRKIR